MRDTLIKFLALLVITFSLSVLTACSFLPDRAAKESWSVDMKTDTPDAIIRYNEWLRKQPVNQLTGEYEKTRKSFLQEKNDTNRIRLILFLILPGAPFRDTTAALTLLNEWPKDTPQLAPGYAGVRTFLTPLLAEIQSLNQSVGEASHKTQEMSQKVNVISQKLKEEQVRSETLQNQINEIKSMEKHLTFRKK